MKKTKSIKFSLFLIIIVTLFTASCTGRATQKDQLVLDPISESKLLLGTVCRITIYEDDHTHLFAKSFSRIEQIEDLMSRTKPMSEISLINESSGSGEIITLSDDTYLVLIEALDVARRSTGLFDPTIGPLVDAWGIGTDGHRIPEQDEIDRLLALVDYSRIDLQEDHKTVNLPVKGMALDLGAIAKGYAADEVRSILTEAKIESAIINLGGNILTVGKKPDGSSFRIGIQDPLSDRGEYLGIVSIQDKAVVTSGVYERFFIQDNKRYHHIIDTRTGYPVESSLLSVSIIADDSFIADALSTAAFVAGVEKGLQLIDSYPGVEAIFITEENEIILTSGISDDTIPFELLDESYTIITAGN